MSQEVPIRMLGQKRDGPILTPMIVPHPSVPRDILLGLKSLLLSVALFFALEHLLLLLMLIFPALKFF